MKIVILDFDTVSRGDIEIDAMQKLGEVKAYGYTTNDMIIERIGDAEIVFCNKSLITRDVFEACPNIRYIGLFATGFNNVDLTSASEHKVVVCNVANYSTDAVAQHVFGLMLHHFSKTSEYIKSVADGDWIASPLFSYFHIPIYEISGLTLGIIGYGNIGKKVAQIANAFGMKVIAYTRTPPQNADSIEFVSQDELFKRADVISIHCPLNEHTKEFICLDNIKKMKQSAFLINCARGGLVNEDDLAFALNNGLIAGAGLDVLSVEPMLSNNPLKNANNCYITPHVAWAPKETRERLLNIVIDNFNSWLEGKPKNVVND